MTNQTVIRNHNRINRPYFYKKHCSRTVLRNFLFLHVYFYLLFRVFFILSLRSHSINGFKILSIIEWRYRRKSQHHSVLRPTEAKRRLRKWWTGKKWWYVCGYYHLFYSFAFLLNLTTKKVPCYSNRYLVQCVRCTMYVTFSFLYVASSCSYVTISCPYVTISCPYLIFSCS